MQKRKADAGTSAPKQKLNSSNDTTGLEQSQLKPVGANLVLLKVERDEKYSVLNLTAIEDSRLSWIAKSVHTYLATRPPNWKVFKKSLQNVSSQGRTALEGAIKELQLCGYLRIERNRDPESGKMLGWVWIVSVIPHQSEDSENRSTGNPNYGETTTTNNHSTSNQSTKEQERERRANTDSVINSNARSQTESPSPLPDSFVFTKEFPKEDLNHISINRFGNMFSEKQLKKWNQKWWDEFYADHHDQTFTLGEVRDLWFLKLNRIKPAIQHKQYLQRKAEEEQMESLKDSVN